MKYSTWVIVLALLVPTHSATAQSTDARWDAWFGCWKSAGVESGADTDLLCVIPAAGGSAVELATVSGGEIVARDTVAATGEKVPTTRGTCEGWESTEWSPRESRIYFSSRHNCPDGQVRTANGLLSITPDGEWLDVRGLEAGGSKGVRVRRYRAVDLATLDVRLPDEIARVAGDRREIGIARATAGHWLRVPDVIEASQRLHADVVEAWLTELGQPFSLGASELTQLADAGVPGSVTDVMVALSYRKYFAVTHTKASLSPGYDPGHTWGPGYDPGYGYLGGYGGWYPGNVVIVAGKFDEPVESDGKVVNGKGYKRRSDDSAPASTKTSDRPRETSSSSANTNSSSESSGSGSSSGRTAKPRDP